MMIDTRFGHITDNGQVFQVLKFDEEDMPYDWDEEATVKLYKEYLANQASIETNLASKPARSKQPAKPSKVQLASETAATPDKSEPTTDNYSLTPEKIEPTTDTIKATTDTPQSIDKTLALDNPKPKKGMFNFLSKWL